jgi:predicted component of type VI protein secretion system
MINRFLLRAPHATETYKEPASAAKPEQYLWGRGIWVLGANIIRSFQTKGHLVGISGLGTGGEQVNLPTRDLPLSRKEKVLTPLEAVLPIDIVEGLPYLGLSPLSQIPADMGGQNQPGMIYLHLAANLKQIPDPEGKQFGLLTVHTSLAYSLMLGRISNLAFKYSRDLRGDTPEQKAVDLKNALMDDIGFKEEDEIQVEARDTGFSIVYSPHLVIHTRRFEIDLEIPL